MLALKAAWRVHPSAWSVILQWGGLKQQNVLVITKLSERHVTIIAPAHLSLFENFIKKKEKCLNDTV